MVASEGTLNILLDMKSRFQSGFSSNDKTVIENLHRELYGVGITNTDCSNCYRDAYILIVNRIKKDLKMPPKSNYTLKAGALLHPAGTSNFYTGTLPSDEIAEKYLAEFPEQIVLFASHPHDWEERAKARTEKKAEEVAEKSDSPELKAALETIAELKSRNSQLEAELSTANGLVKSVTDELASKQSEPEAADDPERDMELETLKADLELANSEITNLKNENRALKAANTKLKKNAEEGE